MARIPVPARYKVRLHATSNAGYPQVFSTYMILGGQRECIDERLGPGVGYRYYTDLPVPWTLEVIGEHIVYGRYVGSNEGGYNPNAPTVVIGYDDSGGSGVDFSNLIVYAQKAAVRSRAFLADAQKPRDLFELLLKSGMLISKTVYRIQLTDGSGDDGYAVILKKEAAIWEDVSSAGHEISSITQSGNVKSPSGALECRDGEGGSALTLQGASWDMSVSDTNAAHRQHNPGGNIEQDWSWEVVEKQVT
ncbi:hypothetical protein [Sinorhizobium meliloti]|uniref:hypothetical protein n=1 Tax=Rhizobium meliloti TaxID=382 RepID=UPI000FD6EC87|nr:hypothetical protein [Sinorhizobium meliloti]RVL61001.1 hypothetical protein CN137_17435 [Sinorhizobium meliloti]